MASHYSCGHCRSHIRYRTIGHGVILADVFHDETCPVFRGLISDTPDMLRMAQSE